MSDLDKDAAASQAKSAASDEKPAAKSAIRLPASLRNSLRWVMVALIALVVGALLITFAFYVPTQQKLDQATTDLSQANQTIAGLDTDKATLTAQVETLTKALALAEQHTYLLQALTGVQTASQALADGDATAMTLSLQRASQALDSLAPNVDPIYKAALEDMKQNVALAQTKMKADINNALPHLELLETNLKLLEDNLFPNR